MRALSGIEGQILPSPMGADRATDAVDVDVNALGCAKCRWGIFGCNSCRATPVCDRSRCPPLEARPGYKKYAASRGIAVVSKKKTGDAVRETTGKRGRAREEEGETPKEVLVEKKRKTEETRREERDVDRAATAPSTSRPEPVVPTPPVEKVITAEVDCGRHRAAVIGRKGDRLQALQWKSGTKMWPDEARDGIVVIEGSEMKVSKARVLVKDAIEQAVGRAEMAKSAMQSPPKRKSLDVMSIVKDVRKASDVSAELRAPAMDAEAQRAVETFRSKLPNLSRNRDDMFECTQDALKMSTHEGVPETIVEAIDAGISDASTSARQRLTLFYLLDSIFQASRVDNRGGSSATHAAYSRAVRGHLMSIVKNLIAVVPVSETEMHNVEILEGGTEAEAHARHRRRAVQKVFHVWEKREVLSVNDIAAYGRKAISKYRHEALQRQVKEFDKRLERQPEAKVIVQADGKGADEFDDIAAMLGNQYGGISAGELNISALRSESVNRGGDEGGLVPFTHDAWPSPPQQDKAPPPLQLPPIQTPRHPPPPPIRYPYPPPPPPPPTSRR